MLTVTPVRRPGSVCSANSTARVAYGVSNMGGFGKLADLKLLTFFLGRLDRASMGSVLLSSSRELPHSLWPIRRPTSCGVNERMRECQSSPP